MWKNSVDFRWVGTLVSVRPLSSVGQRVDRGQVGWPTSVRLFPANLGKVGAGITASSQSAMYRECVTVRPRGNSPCRGIFAGKLQSPGGGLCVDLVNFTGVRKEIICWHSKSGRVLGSVAAQVKVRVVGGDSNNMGTQPLTTNQVIKLFIFNYKKRKVKWIYYSNII